jgi:hypothetical protein
VTDRQGIGFGWLQNAWLLHARLKIHRGGIDAPSMASTENPRAGSLRRQAARQLAAQPGQAPAHRRDATEESQGKGQKGGPAEENNRQEVTKEVWRWRWWRCGN